MTAEAVAGPADAGPEPPHPAGDRTSLLAGPVRFPADRLGPLALGQPLAEHAEVYGPRVPVTDGAALIAALEQCGLTGQGGAHFPAARKWRTVRESAARRGRAPVVVANAAEGEPASAKDAALLSRRPHLVLDGLVCAAEALGAVDVVVWTHGESHAVHHVLAHALEERRSAGLPDPPIRVVSGPTHYLSGESSAVLRGLAGGPALPQYQREPAAVRGLHGRPTLVHNVETLAQVALLARDPGRHRPGSLVTVLAGGLRSVVEVGPATTLRDAVERGGWPADQVPRAVLVGGYGGTWLPWDRAADLSLDDGALRAAGASLGAGVLAPLPPGACGIAETARVADYLARSSARQCGPCLFGLPAIAGVVAQLRDGRAGRGDLRRLQQWGAEVTGRGACHHPDGAVRLVRSAMATFADDVTAHRRRRPCVGADRPGVLPVPGSAS